MMKEFTEHTQEQHKLFEWLASDVANFQEGQNPGAKVGKAQHEYAREILKQSYMKHKEYKPNKKAIQNYIATVDKLPLTEEEKLDLKLAYVKSVQDVFLLKSKTFSTARYLFSKESMTDFIEFIIGTMKESGIPFRNEISQLLKEQEYESWVWICLRYRTCEVCGVPGDLHHVDHVGSYGRKNDDGRGKRVTCLCRKHHNEIHSDYKSYKKYGINGIYLTDERIKILKSKYKWQFKAFKE